MEDKIVFCPLVSRKIQEIICQDVQCVAEHIHPARFAPQEFRDVPDFEKICYSCPNHEE